LVQAGIPADQIDAGYEWVGYHASSQGDPTQRTSTETFYRSWWPEMKQCGVVTSQGSPPNGGTLIGTLSYDVRLFMGPTETLYLYRDSSDKCASGLGSIERADLLILD
jgi:hypothetical protein